jgi:hypothetical protein
MPRAWIYNIQRPELIRNLENLRLDTSGTVTELRQRLRDYAIVHPEYAPLPIMDGVTAIQVDGPEVPQPGNDPATVMNQIRKWGCNFDGKDPASFLERIEELQLEYGYAGEQLLRGLPELLRGDALLWYRNNRTAWHSWGEFLTDFREYFFPRRYLAKLKRDIQARLQGGEEPYRKFATDLLTMMRRAGGYSPDEQTDILYENMHPRYKLYIPRDGIIRAADLLRRAEEYEDIHAQCNERQKATRPATAATAYDRNECCWRCKQRGHTRFDCRRIAKKFCSQCGKDGVFTRDCHPPPGNAKRAGEGTETPRPSV